MINKNRLMGAIVSSGFTQRSLAQKMGISKNTLNNKINGRGYFDTQQIDMICEVLGISDDKDKIEIFLANPSQNRDDRKAG